MTIPIEPRLLPRGMRLALTLIGLLALGFMAAVAFIAFTRSIARAEASTATREVLADDIGKFKLEAKAAAETAAREGAEKAVREAVAPLANEVRDLQVGAARVEESIGGLRKQVDKLER